MSSLIRRPVDQRSLSTPHSFSQTATSFIACNRQGIHHIHLVTWSYNPTAYCPVESQATHNVVRCFSNLKVLKNSFLSLNAITTRFQSIHLRLSLNQRLRLDWNALLTKLLKNTWRFRASLWSYHTRFDLSLKKVLSNFLKSPIDGGAERNRTDDILLAKQTLYQLSYSPVCFAWWVRKDSNLRPPPYQDGALTSWAKDPRSRACLQIFIDFR